MSDNKQKINCTVNSCKYNNQDFKLCELKQVCIKACPNCSTGNPEDESMCGNYTTRG